MVQDHRADVASLRRMVKAICPTVSVKMSRGTAWGNVGIRGSGENGRFTSQERDSLTKMGLTPGGNYCVIMSAEVEYWAKRLGGRLTPEDVERFRRYNEYSRCD